MTTTLTRERIAEVMATLPEYDGTIESASRVMEALDADWTIHEVLTALGLRLGKWTGSTAGAVRPIVRPSDGVTLALVRTPMDTWARIRSFFQRPRAGCSQCGGPVPDERCDYSWPMCHECLPPPAPLPVRRKCGHCIHDTHRGMCTGRNGGTAYPCPCIHSSGGET